jgi:hypothetical protein
MTDLLQLDEQVRCGDVADRLGAELREAAALHPADPEP